MKQNDVVKYYWPEPGEENLRFTVLFVNEVTKRASVQLIDDSLHIRPIEVVAVDELQSAEHDNLIPKNAAEAIASIVEVMGGNLETMSKEQFLKGWFAIACAFPGLHPDDAPAGEVTPTMPDDSTLPDVLKPFDERSGWPLALLPIAAEAWSRQERGELSDDEMYPVDAQRAAFEKVS